jgi:hypothetical protein
VVGVSSDTKDAICHRIRSLEELKEKTECELRRILLTASRVPPAVRQEDLRRLCRSLHNLRKYTDALVYGSKVITVFQKRTFFYVQYVSDPQKVRWGDIVPSCVSDPD